MLRLKYNEKKFKILDSCSFKSSNNEVTFNDITIDFTGYSLEDIPFKYQKIEVVETEEEKEEVKFTGYLDTIDPSVMQKGKKKGFRELTLTLLSPLKMATVRTVSLIGTYNTDEAIRRILQPLADDGFTINQINVSEEQITTNFVLETIENAMNNICFKCNIFWFINERREIYVNSIDSLFGNPVAKTITENDDLRAVGLLNIKPKIENTDYSNIINFKNVRLIYSQRNSVDNTGANTTIGYYPIIEIGKTINKGDIIEFKNPIIIDENTLRDVISETEVRDKDYSSSDRIYYALELDIKKRNSVHSYDVRIRKDNSSDLEHFDKYDIVGSITFSDDGGNEGEVVLQRDSFFSNLITGFKWNGEDGSTISTMASDTALRYTTMKFVYTKEIEKLKGIISDSGQIEKTIDYNDKWTTLNKLINYARSLMTQNLNTVNSVDLEYDINPNLKIGDIVSIQMPSFYISGNFAVKEINYNYENKIKQNWKITLKNADLISTYIDMFRPAEQEETQDKIDTVILSEFIEENIKEVHTISISQNNSITGG